MRINEQRIYTMYLSVSEFDIFYPITESIPYGYRFEGCIRDEEGEYILTLSEDMLDDIKEALEKEMYIQEYEECNRMAADDIKYLLNDIYYELNY